MQHRKIVMILGHSDESGLNGKIFAAYLAGAKKAHHEVKSFKLGEMHFDPVLSKGYREIQALEPDLAKIQAAIQWADHLVFVFPTWWSSFPAILKGMIDRIFLPGFGFCFEENTLLPHKLLRGKSARLIATMDAPTWIYRWYFGAPGIKILKRGVLEFCGIKPVRTTLIGRAQFLTDMTRNKKLLAIEKLGQKGA